MFKIKGNVLAKLKKLLLLIAVCVGISAAALILLFSFGVLTFDGELSLNRELFESFSSSWYGWFAILIIQLIVTTLLCFVPGTSMMFIILIQAMFEKTWQAFLLAFTGVLLSSLAMFFVGRVGGYKLCSKILGADDCRRASELLNKKAVAFFPVMMLFPMFPDDALVMVAGTIKMSLKWFIPSIIVGRGIGIATIVFGLGAIPYDRFTTPLHWIAFVLVCILIAVSVFYLAYRLNLYLDKKRNAEE